MTDYADRLETADRRSPVKSLRARAFAEQGRSGWYRPLAALGSIGASSDDSDEARLQKALFVASTLMMASLAVLWVPPGRLDYRV